VNGVHDMGGMHGMGPVEREAEEPVFHAPWERRAFAVTLAAGFLGRWTIDMARFARERIPPARYLATSYYEHWLDGLERLLVEKGLLSREELEARLAGRAPAAPAAAAAGVRVLRAGDVPDALLRSRGARRSAEVPARFKPGQAVVTRNLNPAGHTRLPRYARGRRGLIDRDHGVFVFPDASAAGAGEKPQHLYSVRFAARELWGPDASPRDAVYIDLWDDYLDPA
jgi:nitrile hydratase beta subunit